ncbi:MAG: DUF3108 domain-containing protein [Thermodesulfovibrionales bacterium]|jgi:hypothetical protein
MKAIKNKPITFILAILLSFTLHVAALGGIKGFSFPDPLAPNVFIANLEREEPSTKIRRGSIRDILRQKQKQKEAGSDTVPSNTSLEQEETRRQSEQDLKNPSKDRTPLDEDKGAIATEREKSTLQESGRPAPDSEVAPGEKEKSSPDREQEKASAPARPFSESLNYDISWLGIYVGNASIGAVGHDGTVTISSRIHSAPFISNFYMVEDYAESRIIDGMPAFFRIKQHEGKYRSNKETIFDMNSKKVTYIDHLKDIKNEHPLTMAVLWDVISGFYHLRMEPLAVGQTIFLDVFDSNKFLAVEVDVLGKEKLELFDGSEINTIIVRPILKTEGLFQKKGDILIWLTDDDLRIPVKVETEVPIGKVVVTLKGWDSESEKAKTIRRDLNTPGINELEPAHASIGIVDGF